MSGKRPWLYLYRLPKVVRPKKAEDYRPVNMLPTIEKLLETVIKCQLIDYIEEFILTEY